MSWNELKTLMLAIRKHTVPIMLESSSDEHESLLCLPIPGPKFCPGAGPGPGPGPGLGGGLEYSEQAGELSMLSTLPLVMLMLLA